MKDIDEKLSFLIAKLEKSNHLDAKNSIIRLQKYSQATDELSKWQEVLNSLSEGYASGTEKAISNIKNSANLLMKEAEKLKTLDKESIEAAIDKVKKANFKIDEEMIKKIASNPEIIEKDAQLFNMLGKVAPAIGVIFSGMFALKNLAAGIYEVTNLINHKTNLNMSWAQVLNPDSFSYMANNNKDNPEKLKDISIATQISKQVWDEGISLIANSIDFVKDLLFIFINLGTGGLTMAVDIGLSIIIMIAEMSAEKVVLEDFQNVLNSISDIANAHIKSLTPALTKWWEKKDDKPLEKWWEN